MKINKKNKKEIRGKSIQKEKLLVRFINKNTKPINIKFQE